MKIKISQEDNGQLKEFNQREWLLADKEHYGQVLDWETEQYILEASEQEEIVGSLSLKIKAGVAHLRTLIVAHEKREKGVGKALLRKAEDLAREKNAHKIYLTTGKGWGAEKFYTALGYQITGELPNHYFHQDFIELTKFL